MCRGRSAQSPRTGEGKKIHARDSDFGKQAAELILNDVRQSAHNEQRWRCALLRLGGLRDQGGQAGVLTLGEGGFDSAAGIVDHLQCRRVLLGQPLCGAREIELDHLRRARADEKQHLDVGSPREKFGHHTIEFVVRIGQTRQVPLFHDGRGEPGLCEHHDARGRLNEMRAGS